MFQKAIRCALFGAALSMLVAGAASADDAMSKAPAAKAAKPAAKSTPAKKGGASDEVAVFDTSKGRMVVEFWEKDAPKTVANFKKLARTGYFDGRPQVREVFAYWPCLIDRTLVKPKVELIEVGAAG